MSDMGEFWKDIKPGIKERSIEKRTRNRENSTEILQGKSIKFTSNNNGVHLIVEGKDGIIDFWPGTGKYISRDGKYKGRGVKNVIKLCV